MKSPTRQQEVRLDEGEFIELEVEGQDSEFPDDAIESESPLKKMLEALQEKIKKQDKKTKKMKTKNKKLKEQVTSQKEVTHTDPRYHRWWTLMLTPHRSYINLGGLGQKT